MGGIVGGAEAEEWREGWEEVEEEEMECDREVEAVVAARKTPKELGEWESLCGTGQGKSVNKELLVFSGLELIKTQFNRFNRTSGVFLSNVDAAGTGCRYLQLAHDNK